MAAKEYASLREAILAVLARVPANEERPVRDVVEKALDLHPIDGATPVQTGAAIVYTMCKRGELNKGERGMVCGTKSVIKKQKRARAKAAA